ncbi:MAG TPA: hypothetical protein VIR30_14450, partial [Nocardioides sp.]
RCFQFGSSGSGLPGLESPPRSMPVVRGGVEVDVVRHLEGRDSVTSSTPTTAAASSDALSSYFNHSEHLCVIGELLAPMLESKQAVQFETR